MITTLKEKKCFVIRNNFISISFHQERLRIEQTNLSSSKTDINFVETQELPAEYSHLFNSIRHLFNYITGKPQCIIQITEDFIRFMVAVNENSHICSLPLEILKLDEQQFWLKKNSYQLNIRMHEVKLAQQKRDEEAVKLRKQLNHAKELTQREKEKLEQVQSIENRLVQQIIMKKQENRLLQECLRNKEAILADVKTKQGVFVALDDQ